MSLKKNLVQLTGLDKDNFQNYNPKTNIGQVYVKAFDQSEIAISKFLLMIGIESIYTSQKEIYNKYNFQELKNYLINKNNLDWVFLTTEKSIDGSFSIPTFIVKHRLNKIYCKLRLKEVSEKALLFNFSYGGISMVINILNRSLDWVYEFGDRNLYPEHFRKKIKSVASVKTN